MEKNDLKIEKDKENSQKILRYPFNGRSSYLIDKFYIIGFNQTTLSKYLYDDENLKKQKRKAKRKRKIERKVESGKWKVKSEFKKMKKGLYMEEKQKGRE